ncbi:MAG: ATP-dependent RNA helicase RhlE [Limisphaerales bacterium]|jgi:ATP-dependent RNA helicase RhlE
MSSFDNMKLIGPLRSALDELGFVKPTPIQTEAFNVIRGGKNVVGISQTGTGKTLAYLLPILNELKFTKQDNPRVLVLVPTRELVLQLVDQINEVTPHMSVRAVGVFGGTNINTQKITVEEGCDIIIGTPGRLYDLVLAKSVILKGVKQVVIDEVDVMLDLGFRFQLINIFELLPEKRQNIMFSATMTVEIDELIEGFFIAPTRIAIAVSGTPLENISQTSYEVKNFYTKVNLLAHLLRDEETFSKALVFVSSKKNADRVFGKLEEEFGEEMGIIHSNKSQNYRIRSIKQFDEGKNRILIATDVMARGLDLDKITHVFNFDTPDYPENYMHRIGRTGRAEQEGKSILFYTENEEDSKLEIETLMDYEIPEEGFPEEVEITSQLTPEERPRMRESNHSRNKLAAASGAAFHEKKDKNKKVNLGGKYKREIAAKYKKPKRRGDKILNSKKKKRS